MDGLMLDSERVYREIFNRAAADCSIDFPEDLHDRLLGRNTADTRDILRAEWGDESLFDRFMERVRHHHHTCFEANPPPIKRGLHELLDVIESRNVPKVVATSTRRAYAIPRLEQAGLLHRFHSVSTGDQVARGKPAPDVFLLAAGTIPMPPKNCVVLEDSEAGVTAAHAAGMTVLMVPDLKQPCAAVRDLAHGIYESLVEARHFLETRLG
jgi:HAD superfamily hydrolase (TIGR01509 family)